MTWNKLFFYYLLPINIVSNLNLKQKTFDIENFNFKSRISINSR